MKRLICALTLLSLIAPAHALSPTKRLIERYLMRCEAAPILLFRCPIPGRPR